MPDDQTTAAFPILFSGAMVRALLDGRKTQTRRLAWKAIEERPVREDELPGLARRGWAPIDGAGPESTTLGRPSRWLQARPGDRLWVRETLERANGEAIGYPADGRWLINTPWEWQRGTLPSIHMPRRLSRLTLTLTEVRTERLQAMPDADLRREGLVPATREDAGTAAAVEDLRSQWQDLWNRLHGEGAWEANPEVVVLSFSVAQRNIDADG